MQQTSPPDPPRVRPWYREPWPWVAIAIPGVAVVGGLFTLYLAISHPDPLVVDDASYRELRSELHAEQEAPAADPAEAAGPGNTHDRHDGEH